MRVTTRRLGLITFLLACAIALIVMQLLGHGSAASQTPAAFGSPPQSWQDASGQPIVALMPERTGVSTLDGRLLMNPDGTPVTAPFGDEARGEISETQAQAQMADALRLQTADACKRGLQVPVGAETTGTGLTAEQAAAQSIAALAKAVAANGGRTTKPAC